MAAATTRGLAVSRGIKSIQSAKQATEINCCVYVSKILSQIEKLLEAPRSGEPKSGGLGGKLSLVHNK
jgi:hypothetical protein